MHGHRGARGIWPENTLLGIQSTFDLDVRVVELDVLLSKDGIPVVTHNATLMPATTRDSSGRWITSDTLKICDLTYEELRQFDVGGIRAGTPYGDRYAEQAFLFNQSIPKLDDIATLVCQPAYQNTWLNIEIKSSPLRETHFPSPADLARKTIDVILKHDLADRVIVQSFDWRVLQEVQQIAPTIARSHLTYLECEKPVMQPNIYAQSPWMAGAETQAGHANLCEVIADMGGKVWSPYFGDVKAEEVARAQELGLVVNAWTVNTRDDIERMLDAGVDGIITDYPGRVQRKLIARGLTWCETLPAPC